MTAVVNVLLVEDDEAQTYLQSRALAQDEGGDSPPYRVTHVSTLADALFAMESEDFDVVLLDLGLPDSEGLDTLEAVRRAGGEAAILVLTSLHDEQVSWEALNRGAQDYLFKSELDPKRLRRAIRFAIERVRATAERNELRRLQTILDSLATQVAVLDRDGVVVAVNEAWRTFAAANGYTDPSAGVGESFGGICEPATGADQETREQVASAIEAVVAGRLSTWYHEYSCDRPDSQRFYSVRITTSDDPQVAVVVSHEDITSRKAGEQELQESERRFRLLAELMPQLVWSTTADGFHDYFNQRWYDYTGMPRDGSQGWNWKEYLHPEDHDRANSVWQHSLEAGDPYEIEYRIRRASDGQYRWFIGRALPLRDSEGQVTRWFGTCTDVHEERAARDALRRSEERFRRLFEHSLDGVMLTSPDGTIHQANSAACAMLGYTEAELRSLGRAGVVDPSDARLAAALEQRGRTGHFSGELTFLHKDGRRIPVEISTSLYEDETGGALTSSILRDVTQRKRAEQRIRESEKRYRSVFEGAAEGLFLIERESTGALRYVDMNPALERIGGFEREGFVGRTPEEVFAPEAAARLNELYQQVFDTGTPCEVEQAHDVPSGRRITRARYYPLINEAGDVAQVLGMSEDVTDRAVAVEALRTSEERFRTVVEALGEGVVLADTEGLILYANRSMAEMTGYAPDELIGRSAADLLLQESDREIFRREVRAPAADSTVAHSEVQGRRKDGTLIWMDLHIGPVRNGEGEMVGTVSAATDVTEKRAREQHLRRVERLASVGTLVAGAAHELNNPLHAIRNFAELMLLDERPVEDQESLEIIRREADRAAKVVSDLRRTARDTQDETSRRSSVDLNDVVRHVLRLRRYSLDTGNVEVRKDLAEELPPVLANRGEMEQLVLNLVVNAEQAMEDQLGTRRLILRTRRTPDGASVHVVDNGPGIPADFLDHIYDPFFTTKAPGEGTGLGLALVHSIVTEHGGAIHVESEPGKGAAFHVDLPRALAEEKKSVPESTHPGPARALQILVVDDEMAIRRVAVRYLEHIGHQVDEAAEGGEALRLLDEREYDVILSDLRMPGLGGEALLQGLRERGGGLERRLIFVTGDAASARTGQFLSETSVPVLVKPVQLIDLGRAVEAVAREHSSAGGKG